MQRLLKGAKALALFLLPFLFLGSIILPGCSGEEDDDDSSEYGESPVPETNPTVALTEANPSVTVDGVYDLTFEIEYGRVPDGSEATCDATYHQADQANYGVSPTFLGGEDLKFSSTGVYTLQWDAAADVGQWAGDVEFWIYCILDGYEIVTNYLVFPVDTTSVDLDGDGYTISDGDCDDANPAINEDAIDKCDGVDNDCNGTIDEAFDNDGDGFADCGAKAPDCDDTNPAINPSATETCNGVDDDCDGQADEGFDLDSDGFSSCQVPLADCNDLNAAVNPNATETCNGVDDDCNALVDDEVGPVWYADLDEDGYGSIEETVESCTQPEGYVEVGGDCDDFDQAINPGVDEPCSSQTDLNCDGEVGYSDNDGDGYAACMECDDSNSEVNPSATEICDGIDNDCNGTIDTDSAAKPSWYVDADVDGSGSNATEPVQACNQPSGYVAVTGDCDDANATINPNATELCDGKDNNCDGNIDTPEAADATTWYSDVDGDGYGNPEVSGQACSQPEDYVSNSHDCNDTNVTIHPEAKEVCNGIDEDCDDLTDEGVETVFYLDQDGDGYGDPGNFYAGCSQPDGYVENNDDCGPADPTTFPGATEYADGVDNDCDEDGAIDEDLPTTDDDGDGFSEATGDCDDANRDINPNANELCDGIDNDCDGELGEDELDNDGDGFTGCDGDCDDTNSGVKPGTTETCNGVDDNCDGVVPTNEADSDRDGQRICSGDCDDANNLTYTGAVERCDSKDNNCDGQADETCALVGYDYLVTPSAEHPDNTFTGGTGYGLGQLSDGIKATTNYLDANWVAWRKTIEGNSSVLWKFTGTRYAESVTIGLLSSSTDGIYLPARIEVSNSNDGIYFESTVSYTPSSFSGRADLVVPVKLAGKFFKIVIVQNSSQKDSWVFSDGSTWK